MTTEELHAAPVGAVVYAMHLDAYYRKGRRNTWHPIRQADGQRSGQRDAIRSAYLIRVCGPVTDSSAETERLSKVSERP